MASWVRRVTAWASLAAVVAGLAMPMLPGLHAAATGPDDCAPTWRSGDLGVDAGVPVDVASSEHCVMCHWLRTARSASMHPPVATVPAPACRTIDECPAIGVVSRLVVLEGPSRAPPSAS